MPFSSLAKSTLLLVAFLLINSCSSDSGENDLPPDVTPPQLSINISGFPNSTPNTPIIVSQELIVSISASDAGGINKIEAFIDDVKVGEDTTSPYQIFIDISNYTSKNAINGKYREYTLEIVATDEAGNSSSLTQLLYIDNELPVISEVNLTADQVLAGNTNEISFSVNDNEGLSLVEASVNGQIIGSFTEPPYMVNINTFNYSDGENTFEISATDEAKNTANFTVPFIVDNTGPNISSVSISEQQILADLSVLTASIADIYSGVQSVTFLLNDVILSEFQSGDPYEFEIDPEEISTGEQILTIRALDSLQNLSELNISVLVKRRLARLHIPQNYFNESLPSNHYLFASAMDGTILDAQMVSSQNTVVDLFAPGEYGLEEEFMLTFASTVGVNANNSFLNTYQNVTRTQLQDLTLPESRRFIYTGSNLYSKQDLDPQSELSLFGADYGLSSDESGNTLVDNFIPDGHPYDSDILYAYLFNTLNGSYRAQVISEPVPSDFVFVNNDFETINNVSGSFTTNPANYLNQNASRLELFGFESQESFDNNIFHKVFGYGYGSNMLTSFPYISSSYFSHYSHQITIGMFHSEGPGLPSEVYTIPSWDITSNYSGQTVNLTLNGSGHIVGKLSFSDQGSSASPYEWVITFDSQVSNEVIIPELPVELQSGQLNQLRDSGTLELLQTELRDYENVFSYDDFINDLVPINSYNRRKITRSDGIISNDFGGFYWMPQNNFFGVR
ncbi:Ig-like domain-containing protein [Muriicola jejuensis]|uniref:Cadherin domain-containing protein n=1 Tax=Muriicola jejuensis TaxID=504488 RepID=A0A6P0UDA7_9FLAO|nr:Ig-like domain-containing protein [Muriicola jejuensis]NER11027.1 hypothetical protein [Muriicola jejuensis]